MDLQASIAPTQDGTFARLTLTDTNCTATYFLTTAELVKLRRQVEASDDVMRMYTSQKAPSDKGRHRLAVAVLDAVEHWLTVIDSSDVTEKQTRDSLEGIAHAYATHSRRDTIDV